MSVRMSPSTYIKITALILSIPIAATARTFYVDADATGANDGTSWENAYFYLQDALMFAVAGDEIRVAQGIYRPDDFVLSDRPNLGREETFQLISGVCLKGGYAGLGEPDPNARDVERYETILSGDRDGDDIETSDPEELAYEPSRAENSYHVVKGNGTDANAVLDGFTVSGGNAEGTDPTRCGGGMYNESANLSIRDCTFRANSATPDDYSGWYGGGMLNINSKPILTDCTFTHNFASNDGGGMYNTDSSVTLINCVVAGNGASDGDRTGGIHSYNSDVTLIECLFSYNHGSGLFASGPNTVSVKDCIFVGNSASGIYAGDEVQLTVTDCSFTGNSGYRGGGIYNRADARVINCTFLENRAVHWGGGVMNSGGEPTFVNCAFIENRANGGRYDGNGGGMGNWGSNPVITNCLFAGNVSHDCGGGVYNLNSTATLISNCIFSGNRTQSGGGIQSNNSNNVLKNCTFVGNSALNGGALACDSSDREYPSTVEVIDSILWNGGDEIWNNDGSVISVKYSDIHGGWSGEGNIAVDPCFVQPVHRDPNDEDFWVDWDYHLKSQAGRWDPNDGLWVMDDVTSSCIDAGNPMTPIGHEPFPNGGIINMGAYGGTAEASKSYFGKPPCEIIVAGDINGDCRINFLDFRLMASHWMEER